MMERDPDPDHATEEFWRDFLTRGDPNERRIAGSFFACRTGRAACCVPRRSPGLRHRSCGQSASARPTRTRRCAPRASTSWRSTTAAPRSTAASCLPTCAAPRPWLSACRLPSSEGCSTASTCSRPPSSSTTTAASTSSSGTSSSRCTSRCSVASAAERAVATARALLRATGHTDAKGPWLPLGAGVHTGPAWVGAVGNGPRTDLTALGDTVNTTARLASVAGAGEILVSATAAAADLDPGLERRARPQGQGEPDRSIRRPRLAAPAARCSVAANDPRMNRRNPHPMYPSPAWLFVAAIKPAARPS